MKKFALTNTIYVKKTFTQKQALELLSEINVDRNACKNAVIVSRDTLSCGISQNYFEIDGKYINTKSQAGILINIVRNGKNSGRTGERTSKDIIYL